MDGLECVWLGVLTNLGLQLGRVVIVPIGSVQKTASGKIRRAATAQTLAGIEATLDWKRSDSNTDESDDALTFVCTTFAHVAALDEDDVDPDAPLDEYDLDSLAFAEIAGQITSRFERTFEATLFYKYETLREVAEYLEASP